MEPWMQEIDPATLPEPYRKLTSLIGMEATMKLAKEFQGTMIYFAKLDSTIKMIRDKKIRDEFKGWNHKDLARRFGLTEAWIRKILSEGQPECTQLTLFNEDVLESTLLK